MTEHDTISYTSPFESFESSEIIIDPDPILSKSIIDIANSPLNHYRDPLFEMPFSNSICHNNSCDYLEESFSVIEDQSFQNCSTRVPRQFILARSEDREIIEEANNAILEISRAITEDENFCSACHESISSSFSRSRESNRRSEAEPPTIIFRTESVGIAEIYDNKELFHSLETVSNPSIMINVWGNRYTVGPAGYGAIETSALSWSDDSESTRWSPCTAIESESERYFVYADDSSSVHTEINPLESALELSFRRPTAGKYGGSVVDLKEYNRRLHVGFVLEQLCERVQLRIEEEIGYDMNDDDSLSDISRELSPYPQLSDFDLGPHADEFYGSPDMHSSYSNNRSVHYIYDNDFSCSDGLSGSPFSCRRQIYEIIIGEGENETFDCRFSFEMNRNNENLDEVADPNSVSRKEVNLSDLSWRTQSFNGRDQEEHSMAIENESFCATPIFHDSSGHRWAQSPIESSYKNSFESFSKFFDCKSVERIGESVDESLISCLNEAEQLFAKDPVCRDLFAEDFEVSHAEYEDYDNEVDCDLTPRLCSYMPFDGAVQSSRPTPEILETNIAMWRNGFVSCSNFFDLCFEDENIIHSIDLEAPCHDDDDNYMVGIKPGNIYHEDEPDAIEESPSEINCDLTPRLFSFMFDNGANGRIANECDELQSTPKEEYSCNYQLLSTSNYFDYELEDINSNSDYCRVVLYTESESIGNQLLFELNRMSSEYSLSDNGSEIDSEMTPRLSKRFVDDDELNRPMMLCGVSIDTETASMYLTELSFSLDDYLLSKNFMEDDFFPENTYSLTIDTGGNHEGNAVFVEGNYDDSNIMMRCGTPCLTKWFLDSTDADDVRFSENEMDSDKLSIESKNAPALHSSQKILHQDILSMSNFFDFPSDEEGSIDSEASFAVKVLDLDDSWRYQGILKKREVEEEDDRESREGNAEEEPDCEITPRLSRYILVEQERSEGNDDIHDADVYYASSEEADVLGEEKTSQEYFDDQHGETFQDYDESPSSNDDFISAYKMSPSSNIFKDFCCDDATGVSSSSERNGSRSSLSGRFSTFSFSGSPELGGKKSLSERSMIQRAQAYLSPSALMKLSPQKAFAHLKKKFRRKKSKADDSDVVMPIGERRRLKVLDTVPSMSVLLKSIRDEKSLLVIVQLETADEDEVIIESISAYLSVIVDSCIEVSCRLSIGVQMYGVRGFHWFALSANNKSISLGPQNVGNMLHVVRKKAAFTVGYDCTKARKQNVDFSDKIMHLLTNLFATKKAKTEGKNLSKEDIMEMQKDLKDTLKLLPDVTDVVLLCDYFFKSRKSNPPVDPNLLILPSWKDYTTFKDGSDSIPEDWLAFRKKYIQKDFHFIREMLSIGIT
eukprot:gene24529-32991_t